MSAILSDADLNDFISPGLACIKPAGEVRANNNNSNDNGEYEIQIGSNGEALEVSVDDGTVKDLPSASISLQDCLACSGCITSAEEVLLAKQTHTMLLEDLQKYSQEKIFAFSISHQSRVSLSLFLNIPIHKVDEFLINMFSEKYGFKFAVGTELGRVMSINKINNELIEQKLQNGEQGKVSLSSICPGFVLYVEKTKPEILPYLLNVKSPQQITGILMKSLISKQLNIQYKEIYHLSIMPCFDKKLEAARPEDDSNIDVDCVLTPKELIELIKQENINIYEYMTKSNEAPTRLYEQAAPQHWPFPVESWDSHYGSASGGYAENYIMALQRYYQSQGVDTKLKEARGKNTDVVEWRLLNSEGVKLGSSAIVNGFRNIQNLVRKLKPTGKVKIGSGLAARRKARQRKNGNGDEEAAAAGGFEDVNADPASCDFVEVMACPGGCINGGGINGPVDGMNINNKDFLNTLVIKYEEEFNKIEKLQDLKFVEEFIEEFKKVFGVLDARMFRYKLNAIEKATDILSVGNKW